MEDTALLDLAEEVARNAYSPYSKFSVGAAILWKGGEVTTGVNVENASYPLTVCAERNAVASGIAQGQRQISAVAVWANSENVSPCGACRQVLAEFSDPDLNVRVCLVRDGEPTSFLLSALLPEAFRFDT